jgi:hypothetical protein
MPKRMEWLTTMHERIIPKENLKVPREVDRVEKFPWSPLVGKLIRQESPVVAKI